MHQHQQIRRFVDRHALLIELLAAGRMNVRLKIRMETTAAAAVEIALVRRWIEMPCRLIRTVPKRRGAARTEENLHRYQSRRGRLLLGGLMSYRPGLRL